MTKTRTIRRKKSIYRFFPLLIIGVFALGAAIVALATLIDNIPSYKTPEKTWLAFIDAINDHDIRRYAKTFYEPGTEAYNDLVADEELAAELASMSGATTTSFVYDSSYGDETSNTRVATITYDFAIGDHVYTDQATVVFTYRDGRWFLYIEGE